MRRLSAALALAFAAGLLGPARAAATEPPIPAPGQEVPLHAAGGWPTKTTGDDKIPPRSPEQQKRLEDLTSEMKRVANLHGPDAVVLQTKFLMTSVSAGAVGATEVRVAGPSSEAGPGHLQIDVATGLFFVDEETSAATRQDRVWEEVALPVLDAMGSFVIEPEALELVFLFDVQASEHLTDGQPDPGADARREVFRARLDRALLDELVADTVQGGAVTERVSFVETAPLPVSADGSEPR